LPNLTIPGLLFRDSFHDFMMSRARDDRARYKNHAATLGMHGRPWDYSRTMGQARVAAEGVLLLHVLWCVWVLLGWTVTRGRRVLRMLHITSLAYAIVIQLLPWPPCPLTVAETQLEARAGIKPAHGPFLVQVLDAIVYPDLPEWLVVGVAVVVCVAILGVYLTRYLGRRVDGMW
jgi:hypothetical protein